MSRVPAAPPVDLDPARVMAGAEAALTAARTYLGRAQARFADSPGDDARARQAQFTRHALAWTALTVRAMDALFVWAERRSARRALEESETVLLAAAFGESLAQLTGGIAMSQSETARPTDLGTAAEAAALATDPAVRELLSLGAGGGLMARAGELVAAAGGELPAAAEDETVALVRAQCRRFAEERIAPHAQRWHAEDALIPEALIEELGALGVFAIDLDPRWGGQGLGKLAMCVASEELSRASLAAGSLGTRAEIAAGLLSAHGTEAQRARWLPGIGSGRLLATAVFTEPEHGSDLANLRTRAARGNAGYRVHGAKTWITHAARADLMTILVRTGRPAEGFRGLSVLVAEKPRGTADDPFPVAGLSGSEIPVLGYRGMKEYELAFDGFTVPSSGLLGGVEGEGFRQLMATFEAARIQTAARALGVTRNAIELASDYACTRRQFGRPLIDFPRVSAKLGAMAVECLLARELGYHAAREKDAGRRIDVEAGMAKLLAARAAWGAADSALQIHGGAGYALESPISRVICDARILNIFEGAAEIQAEVIARGLIGRQN